MKVLVLTADDGHDWAIKSRINLHVLGLFWRKHDFDAIIMVKNAPNDSKYNQIEHFWSYLSKLHAGLTIPETLDDMNDENRTQEEADNYVLDEAIKVLCNLDKNKEWDGHKVTPLPVFTNSDEVEINGKLVGNTAFSEEESERLKEMLDSLGRP